MPRKSPTWQAFETLSENRWSRRDCTEYQEELDWVMRTFCDEFDIMSLPAKACKVAPGKTELTTNISGPRGLWRDFFRRTEDARSRGVRRPVVATGKTSVLDARPSRGWSTRTPSP
jgi:hypothetical protein